MRHLFLFILCIAPVPAAAGSITMTCLDPDGTDYATFQSHNQKVVANEHGVFAAYIHSRNEAYTAQAWRLVRSVDGGKSFEIVLSGVGATNPPVLETDASGTLYMGRVDWDTGDGYLHVFPESGGFENGPVVTLTGGAAGKYAMLLDEARKRLYFFSHNNRFFTVDLGDYSVTSTALLTGGPNAILQYPHLALARDGQLVAAWTTQQHNVYMYWDIHWMVSPDGGGTWRVPGGEPLELPAIADDTGPAVAVTGAEHFEDHTWLAHTAVKQGKVHFMYLVQAEPRSFHYTRYDLASGNRERDTEPVVVGDSTELATFDGFFAQTRDPAGPLYLVGNGGGHVACLRSDDNGDTWHDVARSEASFNIYSLGGYRWVTDGGAIMGTFTDQQSARPTQVHFFRIQID